MFGGGGGGSNMMAMAMMAQQYGQQSSQVPIMNIPGQPAPAYSQYNSYQAHPDYQAFQNRSLGGINLDNAPVYQRGYTSINR
jgi:hypothetical protein